MRAANAAQRRPGCAHGLQPVAAMAALPPVPRHCFGRPPTGSEASPAACRPAGVRGIAHIPATVCGAAKPAQQSVHVRTRMTTSPLNLCRRRVAQIPTGPFWGVALAGAQRRALHAPAHEDCINICLLGPECAGGALGVAKKRPREIFRTDFESVTGLQDCGNGKLQLKWNDKPVVVTTLPGPQWVKTGYQWGDSVESGEARKATTADLVRSMGRIHALLLVLDYFAYSRGFRGGVDPNNEKLQQVVAAYKEVLDAALFDRIIVAFTDFAVSPEMCCYTGRVAHAAATVLLGADAVIEDEQSSPTSKSKFQMSFQNNKVLLFMDQGTDDFFAVEDTTTFESLMSEAVKWEPINTAE